MFFMLIQHPQEFSTYHKNLYIHKLSHRIVFALLPRGTSYTQVSSFPRNSTSNRNLNIHTILSTIGNHKTYLSGFVHIANDPLDWNNTDSPSEEQLLDRVGGNGTKRRK